MNWLMGNTDSVALDRIDPNDPGQLAAVAEILRLTSGDALPVPLIREELRRGRQLVLATTNSRIVGCLFYTICNRSRRIDIVAVHPDWQRSGIGQLMVGYLRRAVPVEVEAITTYIPQSHGPVQQFFRASGFTCEMLMSGPCGPLYRFALRKESAEKARLA